MWWKLYCARLLLLLLLLLLVVLEGGRIRLLRLLLLCRKKLLHLSSAHAVQSLRIYPHLLGALHKHLLLAHLHLQLKLRIGRLALLLKLLLLLLQEMLLLGHLIHGVHGVHLALPGHAHPSARMLSAHSRHAVRARHTTHRARLHTHHRASLTDVGRP